MPEIAVEAAPVSAMDRMYGVVAEAPPVVSAPSETVPETPPAALQVTAPQKEEGDGHSVAALPKTETVTAAPAIPPEDATEALLKELSLTGSSVAELPATEKATALPDFSAYQEVLGKEVKTNEEFIRELKALKETQKQYSEVFKGVDEGLQKLVDIARMGGDWREVQNYVTFDFNSIPAVEYYKDDLVTSGQFPNTPEGLVERDEWLEAQDPRLINALAQPLKEKAVAGQQQFIHQQQQQLVADKSAKDEALRQALYGEKAIKAIGGVEITPARRDNYFQRLASGEVVYKGKDGKPDFDKGVQMLHLFENIGEISRTLISRAKAAGTKAVLLEASNVHVSPNTPAANLTTETKPKSALDRYFGG